MVNFVTLWLSQQPPEDGGQGMTVHRVAALDSVKRGAVNTDSLCSLADGHAISTPPSV